MSEKTAFTYHKIELHKSESLGSGSYGGVCKAKCDGLLCAAKIMHPTLFDLHDAGAGLYLRKFQEECHLLSLARHPNIVQYLATYHDPETKLPVLLMELCDENLTGFLEKSPEQLSYHIQLNICHDISLGLVYLHSNGLIHRDLTGNNILMIAGTRAKITDFGMSKLANPQMDSLTICPGNTLYMSPEALDETKNYTAKLDVFSFGVIIIQILTRQFPNPTDRFLSVHKEDTEDDKEIRVVVPETERRESHLKLIPDICPLKPLAVQCLKKESQRPSAIELSEKVAELKQSPQYKESMQMFRDPACSTQQHRKQITELQSTIDVNTTQLNARKRSIRTKDVQILEYQRVITRKEKELEFTQEQLEDCEQALKEKEKIVTELQQTISTQERRIQQLEQQGRYPGVQSWKDVSKLRWREGKNAPEKMTRGVAVVHENTAYFAPADAKSVYSYQIVEGEEEWSRLPNNPYSNYSLAVVNGFVTSVGGGSTNTLLSLAGEGERKQWSEIFPPMSTPRQSASCITTDQALLVAGGSNARRVLDTVEMMSIDRDPKKCMWTTVLPLPKKCSLLTGTVCGDTVYMAGGNGEYSPIKHVFSCPLSDFSLRNTFRSKLRRLSRGYNGWQKIGTLPVVHSTLVSFGDQLLAIGGSAVDDSEMPTTDVHRYDSSTDTWTVVSQIKSKRSLCFAVALGVDRLVVVGGYNYSQTNSKTVSVEILE